MSLPPKSEAEREIDSIMERRWTLTKPFEWLKGEKRVRRVIRVTADDLAHPPHGDGGIEQALEHLDVEELDWHKADLCPMVLHRVGQNLRILHLYWGGNNVVLRAWSEPEGLAKLSKLEMVHLNWHTGMANPPQSTRHTSVHRDVAQPAPLFPDKIVRANAYDSVELRNRRHE